MQARRFLSFRTFFIAAPLASLLAFCTGSHAGAQVVLTEKGVAGKVDASLKMVTITYDSLLKHPEIVYSNDRPLIGYTVSFMPKGKDYYGPYKTNGSKIAPKQIDLIRQFRNEQVAETRMFIEDATVYDHGAVRSLANVILTLTLH